MPGRANSTCGNLLCSPDELKIREPFSGFRQEYRVASETCKFEAAKGRRRPVSFWGAHEEEISDWASYCLPVILLFFRVYLWLMFHDIFRISQVCNHSVHRRKPLCHPTACSCDFLTSSYSFSVAFSIQGLQADGEVILFSLLLTFFTCLFKCYVYFVCVLILWIFTTQKCYI